VAVNRIENGIGVSGAFPGARGSKNRSGCILDPVSGILVSGDRASRADQ
jgi:hypothetical protein